MIKSTGIILLFVALPVFSHAQADIGVKVGGGTYKITGIKGKSDYGYEGGFFSKAELGKKASLLIELDYAVKKAEVQARDTSFTLELNYVNFRFSGCYDFNEHFFAAAGLSFSYMIEPKQTPKLIPSSYFTHFAVGLDPCVGYQTVRFIFLVRYEYSLTVLTLESTPEAKGNILTGTRFNGLKLVAGVKF